MPLAKSTTGMVQLVKGGGGAWGGGGSFSGGGGHMGGGGGGDHFSSGAWGGCRSAHIARGGDFNGPSVRHGRIASNNWNVKGNWDHHHHHHFNNRFFFTSGPFFYGDYYAYGYGNCAWLRRQAIITGSPYWWNRYQTCLYY
jgi:hypothetical protein